VDIDAAIAKLEEFKKLAESSGAGPCDLVGMDDGSFTVRVKFGEDAPRRKPVLGFAAYEPERKPRKRKGIIEA
jgi:hypothetical protein